VIIVLYEDVENIDDHQTKSQTRQNVQIFNRPFIFLATHWTDSSEFNTLITFKYLMNPAMGQRIPLGKCDSRNCAPCIIPHTTFTKVEVQSLWAEPMMTHTLPTEAERERVCVEKLLSRTHTEAPPWTTWKKLKA
jgi:hypothetical protein